MGHYRDEAAPVGGVAGDLASADAPAIRAAKAVTRGLGVGPVDSSTRSTLHLIAAHILGRRRHEVAGRFGLRVTPGGFGTPAFGDAPEVVRVSGTTLVHEIGAVATYISMQGSTLRGLASFIGTDFDEEFSSGADTPKLETPDSPIILDSKTADSLAAWFALGWEAMDAFVSAVAHEPEPATIQLWPEHFDAGTNIALPSGDRMNVGFSPGDSFEAQPYVYAGPWGRERLGDPEFWNAPFGAVLRASEVFGGQSPVQRCEEFLRTAFRNATGG